jgi:hypothetical protein
VRLSQVAGVMFECEERENVLRTRQMRVWPMQVRRQIHRTVVRNVQGESVQSIDGGIVLNSQTCPTKCLEYKPCVMCQQFKTGPYNETQCADCPFTVIPVDELPSESCADTRTHTMCVLVQATTTAHAPNASLSTPRTTAHSISCTNTMKIWTMSPCG